MTRRVLFYVQHLLGIGHLARASRIARAMIASGLDVRLVTGGKAVPGFPGADIPCLVLPAIAVADGGFKGLVDDAGRPVDEAFLDRRRDRLLAAYAEFRPDIVMIEAFPFGRRQVRFELLPLIAAIEATRPRPRIVVSLRDILQRHGKPERDEETVRLVQAHVDRVLVHGDPAFAALGDSFPLADRIADRIVYTGLVCAPPMPVPADRFDIVVSAGGGAVGGALAEAALGAARQMPGLGRWGVITGPNLPQDVFDRLLAEAPPDLQVMRFRTDFPGLLAGARLSVSQAGYNTVGDILVAGCRALLVPFRAGGETEQGDRAERLARMGRAVVLEERDLSAPAMADAIRRALAQDLSSSAPKIMTDGAFRTAEILTDL